jgi:2C-methyl-D-erythritol 2,4-cyclodiphosphate synthase
VPVSDVQVKGKTNEGLDAVGSGKAIAAQAVVLIERSKPQPLAEA